MVLGIDQVECGGSINVTAQSSRSAQRRILVADDDAAVIRQVTEAVERQGFKVVAARDGREALKLMQGDCQFAAAVLAIALPQVEGTELVRYMKTEKRLMNVPVIMMSARHNPKLPAEAFSAGALVFLPKPFTSSQLLMMLNMLTADGKK